MVTRNVLTERLDSLSDVELIEFAEMVNARSSGPVAGQAACVVADPERSSRRGRRVRTHSCRRPGVRV
jgi:hypothetical protein